MECNDKTEVDKQRKILLFLEKVVVLILLCEDDFIF